MSSNTKDTGSVYSKGGGGTNFEQYIQTAYLTSMIVGGSVPGIEDSKIIEIALQTTRLGYQTDDLLIRSKSPLGVHRAIAQIKHEFSFTSKDELFKEIIRQFWFDFNNPKVFDQNLDKLLIIKENLNKAEANDIKALVNWAKSKSTARDFFLEIERIKKKETTLNIFRTVIERVNEEKIPDEDLWKFFKCLELVAYDFGNYDSTHKIYFLNLIKLSKDKNCKLTESEIWSKLYEFVSLLNKDGGSINLDKIYNETFYSYFKVDNLNPLYETVDKLNHASKIYLTQLSNDIQGFHIERFDLKQQIAESINLNRLTFITGNPGVGKSAIIREVLEEEYLASNIFVFRADQLIAPHLSNVFSNLGISGTIQDILSCVSTTPIKIIFIDSLEKLLEGDSENAFKQLYNVILGYPDIKIVTASRKYAIDLIFLKYGISRNLVQFINIDHLGESEINLIKKKFPQLNQIFENTRIRKLLETPKYIDYSLALILKDNSDFTQISITNFKSKLWSHIVENVTKRNLGMPRKRGKAFLHIAVTRARKMSLFIEPNDVDEGAVDELENDNIIFRNNDSYLFAPTHDILEDWALIKYIQAKKEQIIEPKVFFNQIGNEPAIRRAFRLWVEDSLIDSYEKIIELVKSSLENNDIDKFWADELLISIFKSEDCQVFFKEFQGRFLSKGYHFLKRCIHIIRTTCKENNTSNSKMMYPIGSGWHYIIKLISENVDELDDLRNLIVSLLNDWEYKILLSQNEELPSESIFVKKIVIYYLMQIEDQDDFWFSYTNSHDYLHNNVLSIFFNIVSVAKNDASQLIDIALNYSRDDRNWRLRNFYEKVIEHCLSGIYSRNIVKELPDKICEVAWKSWKYEAQKIRDPFDFPDSTNSNFSFGLKEHISDFPAGIYKTPFWNMYRFHANKAFDFTIAFINYCCENYFNSKYAKDDEVIEIEVKSKEGKIIKQKGSITLWKAYRGTGNVTPEVFRSILISMEKFLLTIASYKNKTSRKLIKHYFYYLLEKSNNVAVTSVLTSLCMAFPEEVEECILSIIGVKEFYFWDFSRASSEYLVLAPYDNKTSFAQEEMIEHNYLPHRKKFPRGLDDFVIHYQFNIRVLNDEIHKIFDELKQNLEEGQIEWKKLLNEIDVRKWEVGEYNKETGKIHIQPKYEDDVKEFVDLNKDQFDEQNAAATYANWATKKFKYEDNTDTKFENWQKAFSYLNSKDQYLYWNDKPGTIAYIGLRDYYEELSQNEIEWCFNTLVEILNGIQSSSVQRNTFDEPNANPLDREPCLKSFSLIFERILLNTDAEKQLTILLFYCLISPIPKHEKKHLVEDFRDNLWRVKPKIANSIWLTLVKYSAFKKNNHYFIDDPDQTRIIAKRKKELKYISSTLDNDSSGNFEKVDFATNAANILRLASSLIPFETEIKEHQKFIEVFLFEFFASINEDEDDRFFRQNRREIILPEDQMDMIRYLSKYLLCQKTEISTELLNSLLTNFYSLLTEPGKTEDIYKFIKRTLEYTICELDSIVLDKNKAKDSSIEKNIKRFWNLWDFLHLKINDSGKHHFSSLLFLDINSFGSTWDEGFKDWEPLKGRESYYKEIILEKGVDNIKSIINVFVSIGHSKLLPMGLNWLVGLLKKNPNLVIQLINPKGERFVENLFHYYCFKIKEDKTLLDNYLWLLDNMIDFGSSLSHLIRENVITYKSK